MERGDAREAIRYWEHLHRMLPSDSQTAATIAANIAQARGSAGPNTGIGPPAAAAAAASASVAGQVSLGEKARRTPRPDETVFVYARPVDGSRLPLAVMKRRVSDLPFAFVLDDSLAMRPDHRLSGASQVVVEARISASGNAMPSEGDLIGSAGQVTVGRRDLKIVIDDTVPVGRAPR
jgi:cytochrome c-type biogenesis protein CcmH